jgi:hypothetical protein
MSRAARERDEGDEDQGPARRDGLQEPPRSTKSAKLCITKEGEEAHRSGGKRASSRVHDAKSTSKRYGAIAQTLWSAAAIAALTPAVTNVRVHPASTGIVRGRRQVRRSRMCCASCGAARAVCGFCVRGGGVGASPGGGAETYVAHVTR